jgi:hypothetical protein
MLAWQNLVEPEPVVRTGRIVSVVPAVEPRPFEGELGLDRAAPFVSSPNSQRAVAVTAPGVARGRVKRLAFPTGRRNWKGWFGVLVS